MAVGTLYFCPSSLYVYLNIYTNVQSSPHCVQVAEGYKIKEVEFFQFKCTVCTSVSCHEGYSKKMKKKR